MKKYVLVMLLTVYGFARQNSIAQFVNVKADYTRIEHNYQAGDSTFIYVFFESNPNTPELRAVTPDGLPGDFVWYRFDNSSQSVVPHQTENGVSQSALPVSQGGYMLGLTTQDGVTDTLRAWIFFDDIIFKGVAAVENNCDFLKLEVSSEQPYRTNPNYFDYYDFCNLNSVQSKFIKNDFTVHWSADADIRANLPGMNDDWKKAYNSFYTEISYPAPLADAVYSAYMLDVFGNKSNTINSSRIPHVATYAMFEVLIADKNGVFNPTANFNSEALCRVKLNNKSINADKFLWVGMDNQDINFKRNDTLWRYTGENVNDEINYTPGRYPISLAVENTRTGCKNVTTEHSDVIIVVAASSLDAESIPNVFTPNGDGLNDIFKLAQEPVSMKTMDIKIYGRNGTLVYKYSGEPSRWEGWNGKLMGNQSECSSGVYYYVISGTGWDDKQYSGKPFTGVIHLFRGQ